MTKEEDSIRMYIKMLELTIEDLHRMQTIGVPINHLKTKNLLSNVTDFLRDLLATVEKPDQ